MSQRASNSQSNSSISHHLERFGETHRMNVMIKLAVHSPANWPTEVLGQAWLHIERCKHAH
uniref:Uncharacterized protein n=1 Tax=Anguilla anguilla TaxID=7936 RepID=A0A0E9QHD0_ANGAN